VEARELERLPGLQPHCQASSVGPLTKEAALRLVDEVMTSWAGHSASRCSTPRRDLNGYRDGYDFGYRKLQQAFS
jgi:hypothetical protein